MNNKFPNGLVSFNELKNHIAKCDKYKAFGNIAHCTHINCNTWRSKSKERLVQIVTQNNK